MPYYNIIRRDTQCKARAIVFTNESYSETCQIQLTSSEMKYEILMYMLKKFRNNNAIISGENLCDIL